jgi:hypothetical protein
MKAGMLTFNCGDLITNSSSNLARSNSLQPLSSVVSVPVRRSKSDQKRPISSRSNKAAPSTNPLSSLSVSREPSRSKAQTPQSNPATLPPVVTVESPSTSPDSAASTPPPPTPPQSGMVRLYQCDLCDYVPSGDEKWKPSNLRRHKRTQHASADKKGSWVCKWEGCTKSFTRSDNLRSHMRDKGHGVEATINPHAIDKEDEEGEDMHNQEGEERGPKRRKLAVS